MTLKIFTLALMCIEYAGFIWSSFFFFKKSNSVNIQILMIKVFGIILILSSLYFTFQKNFFSSALEWLGLLLVGISCIVFYWTIFSIKKAEFHFAFTELEKEKLITSGPYKYIRHPFYSSYIFAWLGASLLTQLPIHAILSAILIALYFKAAKDEETHFLSGRLKVEYRTYVRSTGRFFPRIR